MTCAHVNPYYDLSKSSEAQYYTCTACPTTCDSGKCAIGTEYADNSVAKGATKWFIANGSILNFCAAHAAYDRITLGSQSAIASFGPLYSVSGNYLTGLGVRFQTATIWSSSNQYRMDQIDGLWGLAYPSLSAIEPVFDSFVKSGAMSDVFSMCFSTLWRIPRKVALTFSQTPLVECWYSARLILNTKMGKVNGLLLLVKTITQCN